MSRALPGGEPRWQSLLPERMDRPTEALPPAKRTLVMLSTWPLSSAVCSTGKEKQKPMTGLPAAEERALQLTTLS